MMNQRIYIYSEKISPRLEYILEVIFHRILLTEFELTDDSAGFSRIGNVAKINYSRDKMDGSLRICPHSLMFENDIHPQEITVKHTGGIPHFFETCPGEPLPFDVFAVSFYQLSRYEEYLDFVPDVHGRFPAAESLGYKHGFLHLPIVQIWVEMLKNSLKQLFPGLEFPPLSYRYIDTVDIDIAYRYKGKGIRNFLSFIKEILRRDTEAIKRRIRYYKTSKDPDDTYDYIEKIRREKSRESLYFIQVGRYGKYDKNLPVNADFRKLIRRLGAGTGLGLHPSYASAGDLQSIRREKKRLENVLNSRIIRSRQHYLRLSLPETYELLVRAGVSEDYSMGYASACGFRAGVAVPYPFYNLKEEKTLPLTVFPFQVMDVCLKDYLKLNPDESVKEIAHYRRIIGRYGGVFISLFHNTSLTDEGEWTGWRRVYESFDGL